MLSTSPAFKVTLYFNEDTGARSESLKEYILSFSQQSGVAGATMLDSHEGYGPHRCLHREGYGPL
jgi:PII-like signaling protein